MENKTSPKGMPSPGLIASFKRNHGNSLACSITGFSVLELDRNLSVAANKPKSDHLMETGEFLGSY